MLANCGYSLDALSHLLQLETYCQRMQLKQLYYSYSYSTLVDLFQANNISSNAN